MANFSGHLYGGAFVSAAGALGVYSLGWAGPEQTQMLFFLGVAGGLLPDIDSDNSAPVRGFFTLLGVALAFLVSFTLVGRFPVLELALIWCGIFVLIRYGLFELFARLTVHRGVWHSWLGALFAGLAATNIAFHLAGLAAWDAWLAGAFVTGGYLTHLTLDEMASVDLLGNRVRRSFGTALKPFSLAHPWSSAAMLAAVTALTLPAPTVRPVLELGHREDLSAQVLYVRLLGEQGWISELRGVFD
jgi:hypothetical protein